MTFQICAQQIARLTTNCFEPNSNNNQAQAIKSKFETKRRYKVNALQYPSVQDGYNTLAHEVLSSKWCEHMTGIKKWGVIKSSVSQAAEEFLAGSHVNSLIGCRKLPQVTALDHKA